MVNKNLRHLNTDSDSEVLLNVFAYELQKEGSIKPTAEDIFRAVRATHKRIRGAYSVVIMINGVGIVGFRDPCGIRPLILGSKENDLLGKDFMIASESTVLSSLGFEVLEDVSAGSAVFISSKGDMQIQSCIDNPVPTPCIFEYVYLARPDAEIDKISVHKSRLRMGEALARKIKVLRPDHDIDVVIPIPDTSRNLCSPACASTLGSEVTVRAIVKISYIGRTFIMPGQDSTSKNLCSQKLNPIELGIPWQSCVAWWMTRLCGGTTR